MIGGQMFYKVDGGFRLEPPDEILLNQQRAITKHVNDSFIQVGAIFLKTSDKNPYDSDWYSKRFHDVDLQNWIDDPESRLTNVGFNLQLGWMDVDIDTEDPEYNKCVVAAMNHVGLDTRFQFGRVSMKAPTHVLVQLGEDESANWEALRAFEPRGFRMKGKRYAVQLRSYATNATAQNIAKAAKQTVMPGSIYKAKHAENRYDISVWYNSQGGTAQSTAEIAATTPRKVSFNDVVRAISFGTLAYVVRDQWVEGSRQNTSQKVAGWIARMAREGRAINNNETMADDVYCPVDDDDIGESLLQFVCDYYGDEEGPMRIRTYRDACSKLDLNPDAKIPGWPAMTELIGPEGVQALRTVFMPGSDVHILTKFAERYLYDESDNQYIDRDRFLTPGRYVHEGNELERRHKGDVVRIGGKPKEAFKIFESSTLRKRIGGRDLYPDLHPGGIYRITGTGKVLNDDIGEDPTALIYFNTWRGWPLTPPEIVDQDLLERCVKYLDQLLEYITRRNKNQADWLKKWIAWIIQHPGQKQQIAPVIVGGQGIGKSFLGNTFMQSLFHGLWGSASPRLLEGAFSVEPFIDKMFVFMDEARFRGDTSTEEIKKLIRNVDVSGSEKFQSARNYRIHARMMFASNRMDMNISQNDVQDRALFYIKSFDKDYLNMNEREFITWAATLKPWFLEYVAFISDENVMRHYMYYFMTLPVTKYEVESLEYSSSHDVEIVASNMSYPRRVAKYIIEDGRIYEDMDISYPWNPADLYRRVGEVCKELGIQPIQGTRVMAEFRDAGVIEEYVESGRHYRRFKSKYATLLEEFGSAIGVPMETRFEFEESDYGPNTCTMRDRPPWKGGKEKFYGKF